MSVILVIMDLRRALIFAQSIIITKHPDAVDYATSENPSEHKSHNLIELDNGQFALYPNNRTRIFDNSLTPETPKIPDFKVSTVYYQVENGHDRDGLGNDENISGKLLRNAKTKIKYLIIEL